MKKVVIILVLLIFLMSPIALASITYPSSADKDSKSDKLTMPDYSSHSSITDKLSTTSPKPSINPWNETIIISPTWQTIIGTFFGLNLKNISTQISVKETLVLFTAFTMLLIIILDILKMTPFFKIKVGPVSGEFITATLVTLLISISGALINLKDLIIQLVSYTVTSLDWEILHYVIQHKFYGILVTVLVIFPALFILHETLEVFTSTIKKYSKISRARAQGRLLNSTIENKD